MCVAFIRLEAEYFYFFRNIRSFVWVYLAVRSVYRTRLEKDGYQAYRQRKKYFSVVLNRRDHTRFGRGFRPIDSIAYKYFRRAFRRYRAYGNSLYRHRTERRIVRKNDCKRY